MSTELIRNSKPCPWCSALVYQNLESHDREPEEYFDTSDDLLFWSDGGITKNGTPQESRAYLWPQDGDHIVRCPECDALYNNGLLDWLGTRSSIQGWRMVANTKPGQSAWLDTRNPKEPQELQVANFSETLEFLEFHIENNSMIEWQQWTSIQQLLIEAGQTIRAGGSISKELIDRCQAALKQFSARIDQIMEGTMGAMSPVRVEGEQVQARYMFDEVIPLDHAAEIARAIRVFDSWRTPDGNGDNFGVERGTEGLNISLAQEREYPSGYALSASKKIRLRARTKLISHMKNSGEVALCLSSKGLKGFTLKELGYETDEDLPGDLTVKEILKEGPGQAFYPFVVMFASRRTNKVEGIAMYTHGHAMLATNGLYPTEDEFPEHWENASNSLIEQFLIPEYELWVHTESPIDDAPESGAGIDTDDEIQWEVEPVQKWLVGTEIPLSEVEKMGIFIGYGSGFVAEQLLSELN
jgi:hypothetical protein